MADNPATSTMDTEDSAEPQVTITIKSGADQKIVLTVPLTITVGDLKARLATAEHADVPVERQRLIFSGRILKDHDTLEAVKVKDGNTIHLVKSAASNARQSPANSSSPSATAGASAGVPPAVPQMAAGTGNSPFAQLTGARHAGFHGLPGAEMFGPDGGMGAPPDPDTLLNMMDNPMFVSQMNEMMNNPAVMNMLLDHPHVRNNPQIRMMMQNPEFRRLMLNPDMLRVQLQMQRAMNGGGSGGSFPMPGETDTTAQTGQGQGQGSAAGQTGGNAQQPQQPPNPFAMFGQNQAPGGQANPFAALFSPSANAGAGQTPATSPPATASAGNTPANPTPATTAAPTPGTDGSQANPFAGLFGGAQPGGQNSAFSSMMTQMMQNPEMQRAAMQMMGGMMGQGGATQQGGGQDGAGQQQQQGNPFAGLFNNPYLAGGPGGFGGFGGGSPEPPDNRPPEVRYEDQLRQLNDMGFYEFERNVAALRRSGGSVQGAVEYLLSNP